MMHAPNQISLSLAAATALLVSSTAVPAQSTTTSALPACPTVLSPPYQRPVVGSGWIAQLVATGLRSPRGIRLDRDGGLLVVEKGRGVRRLTFRDRGGVCLDVDKDQTVVELSELNHGIELSADGRTLYASSADAVYSWEYDAAAGSVRPESRRTLVRNMASTDHVSRTLLLSTRAKGTLLVSRGSASNMDADARDRSNGVSQIRSFDMGSVPAGGYDYASQGALLGWGLRNSVGVAEHPITGGVYSVENSADEISRLGEDIHQNNPGEELNFHGILNGTTTAGEAGANYGYPDCFALWDTGGGVPQVGTMTTGSQFTLSPNEQLNDTTCKENYAAPRLTFQAHAAPLDIKFALDGSEAYISFHGSWNRDEATGYKLSLVKFANGVPVEPADSRTAAVDVLSNADVSACPGSCFRPVGLAVDSHGRVFMSSDNTGEIYVVQKVDFSATGGGGGNGLGNGSGRLMNELSRTRLLSTVFVILGLGRLCR